MRRIWLIPAAVLLIFFACGCSGTENKDRTETTETSDTGTMMTQDAFRTEDAMSAERMARLAEEKTALSGLIQEIEEAERIYCALDAELSGEKQAFLSEMEAMEAAENSQVSMIEQKEKAEAGFAEKQKALDDILSRLTELYRRRAALQEEIQALSDGES